MRVAILLAAVLALPAAAQPPRPEPTPVQVTDALRAEAVKEGIAAILRLQQGKGGAEWPYEGVYRVRGQIPWGYRVGGTAICALVLAEAPGYADDPERQRAVEKALRFICESRNERDLSIDSYEGGYDVRSWGHIEAVATLARLKRQKLIPEKLAEEGERAMAFYLDAVHKLETPRVGGWNYARPPGRETPGAPSSFMTSRALQALFEAAAAGYEVDADVVRRGLDFLEKSKFASGAVAYSGVAGRQQQRSDGVPGATGRMCATEATLLLAGRGSLSSVRGACDAFITHWEWLDRRRAMPGTHAGPYAVAPYYFMFAHYYAAQGAEMLPRAERAEYRRRIDELLFSVRRGDGSWNDRVFERSAAYGTAMAILAITAGERLPPAKWQPPVPVAKDAEVKPAEEGEGRPGPSAP
jgi:hypothetical protein